MRHIIRTVISNSLIRSTAVSSQVKDRLIRIETIEIRELLATTKAKWEINSNSPISSRWRLFRLRMARISRKEFGWRLREESQKDEKVDQEREAV